MIQKAESRELRPTEGCSRRRRLGLLEEGLKWAAEQAARTGAELEVVMSREIPAPTYWMAVPETFDMQEESEAVLESVVKEVLGSRSEIEIRTVVQEGRATPVLLARAGPADLLVVGSKGRGDFAGMLVGSVSHHCVSHSGCPVVVVRP